jgi:hypothetical protein
MESRNCQGIHKQGKDKLCILSVRRLSSKYKRLSSKHRRLSSKHRQNVVCVQVVMRYRFQAWWWRRFDPNNPNSPVWRFLPKDQGEVAADKAFTSLAASIPVTRACPIKE